MRHFKDVAICTMILLSISPEGQAGTTIPSGILQSTEGWCSPAVADTRGNVTINCQGVDPKALARLNELLDLRDKQLGETKQSLEDKLKEANDWAQKYHDLSERLEKLGDTSEVSRRAEALVKSGEFEKAGALLDEAL